jgi:peptidoglycan hydrolase-like protein with peptidoglycan-binding domain
MPIGAVDLSGLSGGSSSALTNARFSAEPAFQDVLGGVALSKGAKGPAVGILQTALLDMGFAMRPYKGSSGKMVGGIDSDFGGQTERALKNFQRHAQHLIPSVVVNGKLDAKTLAALDALAPAAGKKAWTPGQYPAAPNPFDAQGEVSAIYSNSVGAAGSSTVKGLKLVNSKLDQAAAEATGQKLWKDKKAFGLRIIDLIWATGSKSGQELHGTFADDQMGQDVSHGCIRHYNADILELFAAVKKGDRVAVVDRLDAPELGSPINV